MNTSAASRRPRRPAPGWLPVPARLRPTLVALAALIVLLALAAADAAPAAANASVPLSDAAAAPRVLVVAVPDLRWSDLSATATPTMWRLLAQGSSGVLSVKSSWDLTGCADGLLTLGAGNRAAAEASSAPAVGCVDRAGAPAGVDRQARTTAGIGAWGAAMRSHGLRTATLGAGGWLALPSADVTAPLAAGLEAGGGAQVVLAVDDRLYRAPGDRAGRAAAVAAVDRQLAVLIDPLPSSSTVLVVGSSDRPGSPSAVAHLHVALARGPDFPPGYLTSSSTKRTPYVELIDVAATVLALVGTPAPETVVGRPWQAASSSNSSSPAARLSALRDLDTKAVRGAHWRPLFMWVLAVLALLVALAALAALAMAGRAPAAVARRATELACYVVACLPVASWLVQVVPWWRWPVLLLPLLLLGCSSVIAAAAALAARIQPRLGLAVITATSALVLVVDLVSGSRLQTAALLGDSPITAGRFYGAGNTAFGVLAASTLLGAGVLLGSGAVAHEGPRPRRALLLRAGAAGLLALGAAVVDGAPTLGADFGGTLALAPSGLLLVLLVAHVRLSVRRGLGVLVVGAIPAVALAYWDYHRPPGRRTHIGRFVADLIDGQGGQIVSRKLSANLHQLTSSPFLPLVLGTVVVVVIALRRHRPRLTAMVQQSPGLVAGLSAVSVCAVLGGLLNDSGVTVTGIMLSVALPTVTALALRAEANDAS